MNTPFNSTTDAINACNAEAERAWKEYMVANKLDTESLQSMDGTIPSEEAKRAIEAAKQIFQYGYFAGARWVTNSVVKSMQEKNSQVTQSKTL